MDSYPRPIPSSNDYHIDEPLSNEELRERLRKQLEYYFSKENILNDIYLQSQMDADNYVPISLIASFKLIKRLTYDLQLITGVLKESSFVEVDREEKKVRSSDTKTSLPSRKRCVIILRNVPFDATETEIFDIFLNPHCPVSALGCERVLESDHADCWYVTFNSEDDAQNAFFYLTRENISLRGQKILARMKACLTQKASVPMPIVDNHPQQQYYQPTYPYPNYYPPTQFIHRSQPVFPTQFWYISSTSTDSYSPVSVPLNSLIRTYNGANPTKSRRITSKSRNSTKPHDEISPPTTAHSEEKNSS